MSLALTTCRPDLRPWNSFGDLESYINDFFGQPTRTQKPFVRDWVPAADMRETDDAYVIELEVPGITKEDIQIDIVDNLVTIKGERKDEAAEESKGFRRIERRRGTFQRSIEVREGFQTDKVTADFKDGLLTLTLPKREDAKPKRVDITVR